MGNREAIAALYDAYARRDSVAMVGALDGDVEWHRAEGSPYSGVYIGPQAVLDGVWRRMGTEWSGWEAVPESIIVDGDRVVAVGT